MLNILEKFDNIEIKNENRISEDDLLFCKLQQQVYDKSLKAYQDFTSALNSLKNNELEQIRPLGNCKSFEEPSSCIKYMWSTYDIKTNYKKIKNNLIDVVVWYFNKKYSIEIESNKFYSKFDNSITYENVIDEIFEEIGGVTFTDRAEQEIKENILKATQYDEKIKLSKNKVIIPSARIIHYDSIWREYRFSYNGAKEYVIYAKALNHFDSNTTEQTELTQLFLNKNECDKQDMTLEYLTIKHDLKTMNKLKSIKLFKNGRIDIEFKSNEYAREFMKDYLNREV